MNVKAILTQILLCSLLVSCGFHLRGIAPIPDEITSAYIEAAPSDVNFSKTLANQLKVNKIHIHSTRKSADVRVIIRNNHIKDQLISITGSAQAGQYLITQQLDFEVSDKHNKVLIKETPLETSRTYNSNATQVLSSDKTIQRLKKDMHQELALEIINRLAKIELNE